MSNEYLRVLSQRNDLKVYTLLGGMQIIGSSYQTDSSEVHIDDPYVIASDGSLSSLIPYTVVPTVVTISHILATSKPNLVLKKHYCNAVLLDKVMAYFN